MTTNRTYPDPGLQAERTAIAWTRTALSLGVIGAVFIRWFPYYGAVTVTPAAVSLTAACYISVTQRHRYSRARAGMSGQYFTCDPVAPILLTLVAVFEAVAALMVITGG